MAIVSIDASSPELTPPGEWHPDEYESAAEMIEAIQRNALDVAAAEAEKPWALPRQQAIADDIALRIRELKP